MGANIRHARRGKRVIRLVALARLLGYNRWTMWKFVQDGRVKPLKRSRKGVEGGARMWHYFDLDDPAVQQLIADRFDKSKDLRVKKFEKR